jgi:cytidyltransferase-like protein
MQTIVITSGYFNPIHPGHIECFYLARELGSELWVIVNNDIQAELKRGEVSFQDQDFRMKVVKAIKPVDKVILSIDEDGTVCETLKRLIKQIKQKDHTARIIFAKGGDRFAENTPEMVVVKEFGIEIVSGLGDKIYNSSDFLNKTK